MSEWFSSCVFCAAGLFKRYLCSVAACPNLRLQAPESCASIKADIEKHPLCDLLSPQSSQ